MAEVTVRMKCEDCGHEQTVWGIMDLVDGEPAYWWTSAHDWCEECNGLPRSIEKPKIVEK